MLLPKIDRERESYGIQVTTMSQLYVKCFGFTSASREAKSLTTQKGFNNTTADYADVVFNVIKDRCPGKCTISVFEMNEYLDRIADTATTTSGLTLNLWLSPWLFINGSPSSFQRLKQSSSRLSNQRRPRTSGG